MLIASFTLSASEQNLLEHLLISVGILGVAFTVGCAWANFIDFSEGCVVGIEDLIPEGEGKKKARALETLKDGITSGR